MELGKVLPWECKIKDSVMWSKSPQIFAEWDGQVKEENLEKV